MVRSEQTLPERKPFDFIDRLREISMFFEGNDKVHRTMRRVAKALETGGIPFAIVGGMAVNAHEHERTTKDVDFLVTTEGFEAFGALLPNVEFERVPGRPRRFFDRTTNVTFDFLVTGMFPGSGKPGPIAYPDPLDVRQTIRDMPVVNLPTLIQLKLAARRHQDFADVVNLIRADNLEESFQEQLHPLVRPEFIECLEEKRREDEYEARQDEQFQEKTQKDKAPKPRPGPADSGGPPGV